MEVESFAGTIVSGWAKLVSRNRDYYFLATVALSSLISLTPLAREASYSNFLIYSVLLVVLVFANRERFKSVPVPDFSGLLIAVMIVIASFLFNYLTAIPSGDASFGLTDYVILSSGLFCMFYSIRDSLVQFGVTVLALLRGATLALAFAYPWVFEGVSSFFVSVVLAISKLVVSKNLYEGNVPGQIIVGGAANNGVVGIGWACAGLEELVIVTALLYILIDSFRLNIGRSMMWLAVGVVGAFVVNIIRMVILVWIAFNYGIEDMLWVHTHIGDVLFLVWIAVFWVVFFRVIGPGTPIVTTDDESKS